LIVPERRSGQHAVRVAARAAAPVASKGPNIRCVSFAPHSSALPLIVQRSHPSRPFPHLCRVLPRRHEARAADDLGRRYARPAREWKTEKTELKNKKIFVCTGRGQGLRQSASGAGRVAGRPRARTGARTGARHDGAPSRHQTEIGMGFGSPRRGRLQGAGAPVSQDPESTIRVRTLFLSDLHLGTKGCQAALLLDFLRDVDADTIYLVGDIVDGWQLRSGWYWPQAHNDVVQKLLRKVRKGAHVVYVPGNHDEFLRDYIGMTFGGVEIADSRIHVAADGKRYLVIHGDQFDMVVRHSKWLAHLGDWAYTTALAVNTVVNRVRRRLGLAYWSLSAWAKLKVKNAVNFIGQFETFLASEARRQGADGVICGHIHHAAHREVEGLTYLNTGDWVESCTGIVEHYDGRMEVLHYPTMLRERRAAESFEPEIRRAVA
jgi:UDP-2,3-diacylglucosamine pyrophosphatase LpxH